jgi:hypothetical protein
MSTHAPGSLRLEWVDPSSLGPNPANWRIHPEPQRAALSQSLDQVGWVKPLIFNATTGHLLDGHMRREDAIKRKCLVPVVIGEWDLAHERTILATLDPIAMMAEADSTAFSKLLETLETTGPDLMGLISQTADACGLFADLQSGKDDDDDRSLATVDPTAPTEATDEDRDTVPDAIYPSNNDLGIPTLDLKLQARAVDFPVQTWGSISANVPMTGTWCFYVDDHRFEPIWKNPLKVLRSAPTNAIEPNFSTHEQHPLAFAIWQTYRKRWCARFWQTRGVRIFVDLNVDATFRAINFLGVPKGWTAFANRAHDQGDGLIEAHAAACEHSGTDQILYLVYGGGKAVKQLAQEQSWIWVPEQYDTAHARIAAQKEAQHGSGQSSGQEGHQRPSDQSSGAKLGKPKLKRSPRKKAP